MGSSPTTIAEAERRRSLQPGRYGQRVVDHRHGLHARRGTRPIRCRCARSTEGLIGRFGAIDNTDGGDTYRYSGSLEWQRSRGNTSHEGRRPTASATTSICSRTSPTSSTIPCTAISFIRRITGSSPGAKVSHRRIGHWADARCRTPSACSCATTTSRKSGCTTPRRGQLDRHDPPGRRAGDERRRSTLRTRSQWTPWLRTLAGLRVDGYRFRVDASDPENGGTRAPASSARRAASSFGPFSGTEFYVNGGLGFHSNDARGTTITRDPSTGEAVDPVTPLVRAKGAEVGVRTVALPHLQTSLTLWTLSLASELVFSAMPGRPKPSRPSHRYGVEFANYYTPAAVADLRRRRRVVEARISPTRIRSATYIPGSVATVISGGVDARQRAQHLRQRSTALFRSAARSSKTTRSVEGDEPASTWRRGYRFGEEREARGRRVQSVRRRRTATSTTTTRRGCRASRLDGVDDIHLHPTLPRTAR